MSRNVSNIPDNSNRAPFLGKRRYIDYQLQKDFKKNIADAFPYMPDTEVDRFIQLVFHEIVNNLHEKRTLKIPFFGNFLVKPKRVYKMYHRDIWNGYGEWIDLDVPLDDWVVAFEASPYLKYLSSHRYLQQPEDGQEYVADRYSNTYTWDKFYTKFRMRDLALRDCPYSLSVMGWSGYQYERLIKEACNAGETIRLTAKDGEVYQIQKEDGVFNDKFQECYDKTKYYMEEVAKRKIFCLKRSVGLRKTWAMTYSKYLLAEKKEEIREVENVIYNKLKNKETTSFFYVLKFGFKFDIGEKQRIYSGYYFNTN